MDSHKTRPNDDDDQLDPSLQETVRQIATSRPGEELVARCVTLAKSQTPVQLVEPAKQKSRRATGWLIAVAIAASVLAVVVLRRPANDSLYVVKPNPPVIQQENSFDAQWVNESPTLWAYHRKADQTPEALDELLVSHARVFRVSGPAMSVFGS